MEEALVFGATFEALTRALAGLLTPQAKARFKEAGVDFDRPLLPAYPYASWLRAMDLASQLLMPDAPERQRHLAMGRRMVDSYGETLIGRALLSVMRVLGPTRTLNRMARNLRTANNYTETKLTVLPDGRHQLWCSRVTSTAFYCGLLQRGVEVAGGKDVVVEDIGRDESGATFTIHWS